MRKGWNRLMALVFVLLLAVGSVWAMGALAESKASGTTIKLAAYGTEPYYVADKLSGRNAALFQISNFDVLKNQLSGKPQWTLVNKAQLPYNFDVYVPESGDSLYITPMGESMEPCELTFIARCQWGSLKAEEAVTVRFAYLPNGLPKLTNLPDKIEMKQGETVKLTVGLDPRNWTEPEGFSFELRSFEYDAAGKLSNALRKETYDSDPFTMTCKALKPGRYWMKVYYMLGTASVEADKTIELLIADENGVVPGSTLELYTYGEKPYYVLDAFSGYNAVSCRIRNFDMLKNTLGGKPQWTLVNADELPYKFDIYIPEEGDCFYLTPMEESMQPCELTFVVRCQWDGLKAEEAVTVRFAYLPNGLPKLTDLPDEINMKLGETRKLRVGLDPQNWTVPEGMNFQLWGTAIDSKGNWVDALEIDVDGRTLTCRAVTPGYYRLMVCCNIGTTRVEADKMIDLVIADANGVVPDLAIELSADGQEPYYVLNKFSGFSAAGFHINNFNYLRNRLGGKPQWTLVNAAELPYKFDIYIEDEGDALYLTPAEESMRPCELTFIARCQWGDLTAEKAVTVRFAYLPNGLPKLVNLPDKIELKQGETVKLTVGLDPQNWTVPEGFHFDMFASAYDAEGKWTAALMNQVNASDPFTMISQAVKPGRYKLKMFYMLGTAFVEADQMIDLIIADENGVVPSPTIALSTYGAKPYYILDKFSGFSATSFYIDNFDYLKNILDGEPQWTLVNAAELPYKFDIHIEDAGDAFYLTPTEKSMRPCELTFIARCQWGGLTAEEAVTVRFDYLPNGLPKLVNLPDRIETKVGETIKLTVGFDPQDGTMLEEFIFVPGYRTCDLEGKGVAVLTSQSYSSDPFTMICQPTKPGRYKLTMLYTLGTAIVEDDKTIDLVIADENGVVPGMGLDIEVIKRGPYYILDSSEEGYAAYVWIKNYEELEKTLEGEPQWTLVNADELPVSFRQSALWDGLYLHPQGTITEPCEMTLVVRCQWGDLEEEKKIPVRFDYLPGGLPAIVESPDRIEMKQGEEATVHLRLDPENWSVPNGFSHNISWSVHSYTQNETGEGALTITNAELENGITYNVLAKKPGHYRLECHYHIGNDYMTLPPVEFVVADENGVVPKDGIIMVLEGREPYYVLGTGQTDVFLSSWIWNYDELAESMSGIPQWTILNEWELPFEVLTGGYDDGHACYFYVPSTFDEDGEYTIWVRCEWGDLCENEYVRVRFAHMPGGLPDIAHATGFIEMRQGEETTVQLRLDPENWTVPEGFFGNISWSVHSYKQNETGDGALIITDVKFKNGLTYDVLAQKPGHYRLECDYIFGNVGLTLPEIDVYVFDENGRLPLSYAPVIAADKTMKLPKALKQIGSRAFEGGDFEAVICQNGLKSIGDHAFVGSALRVITLPDSVSYISETAFEGCSMVGFICSENSYAARFAREHDIDIFVK